MAEHNFGVCVPNMHHQAVDIWRRRVASLAWVNECFDFVQELVKILPAPQISILVTLALPSLSWQASGNPLS